jgi:hypothetical protein
VPTVDCVNSKKCTVHKEVRAAKSKRTGHVRCATRLPGAARGQRTSTVNRSKPPMVYLRGRHQTMNSTLSGVPSTATARIVVGAINTPQPPPFKPSKFSELNIQYKSKRLHSKTQSIDQILSKPPNQLNCLVT